MTTTNKKIESLIIIVVVFVTGCTKDLKEKDRKWNPYLENEIMIFESSEKELDTIAIAEINDNVVSTGPTPKLYEHKSLRVYGRKASLKESKFAKNKILDIGHHWHI